MAPKESDNDDSDYVPDTPETVSNEYSDDSSEDNDEYMSDPPELSDDSYLENKSKKEIKNEPTESSNSKKNNQEDYPAKNLRKRKKNGKNEKTQRNKRKKNKYKQEWSEELPEDAEEVLNKLSEEIATSILNSIEEEMKKKEKSNNTKKDDDNNKGKKRRNAIIIFSKKPPLNQLDSDLDNYRNRNQQKNAVTERSLRLSTYEKKGLINHDEKKYLEEVEKQIDIIKTKKILPRYKIMLIKSLSIQSKIKILDQIDKVEKSKCSFNEESYQKNKKWVESVCQIPFDVYRKPPVSLQSSNKDISIFLSNAKQQLDNCIYGQEKAKEHILEILAKNITNPKTINRPILFLGEKGTGKTSIGMCLSKILNRPFFIDSLGGKRNSEDYLGHSFTYMGSQYGKIVDWLIRGGCMNPIILMDELDKLSVGYGSNDIASLCTHITDATQNHKFTDSYFQGVEISLSRIQWIFSANHIKRINPILLDRFIIINFESFNLNKKVVICRDYLIKNICSNIGLKYENYKISDDVISHLIKNYTENQDSGVREIKIIMEQLFSKINLLQLPNDLKISYSSKSSKLIKNKFSKKAKKDKIEITIDMCDEILKKFKKPTEKYLNMYS